MKTKMAAMVLMAVDAVMVVLAEGAAHAFDVQPAVLRLKNTNECENCNLAGADLSWLRLARAKLANANLGNTDLRNTDLSGADLHNAQAKGGARLNNANLSGANLSGADYWDANLTGTNFTGAIWTDGKRCNSAVGSSIGRCAPQPAPGNPSDGPE